MQVGLRVVKTIIRDISNESGLEILQRKQKRKTRKGKKE